MGNPEYSMKILPSDMVDWLSVPLVVVEKGNIRFVTLGIEEIIHYRAEELIGRPLREIATPEYAERLEDFLEGRLTSLDLGGREKRQFVFKALRGDGEEVWLELRARERDLKGKKAIVGLLVDISDHKRVEERLRERNRSQHTLLANIPGLVYRSGMERDRTMEYLSLETERITGYSFDELMGGNGVMYAGLIVPEDREKVDEAIVGGIRSKEAFVIDYRIIAKDGQVKHIHEIGRGVYDRFGNFVCIEGVAFDVTEQRKAEERFVQAERLHAMGEMASGVAHDFNNVLTGILGRVQLLQYYEKSEKVLSGLKVIEKAARDGAKIVKRIQEFTRTRSETDFFNIDLNNILRDVVDITRPRWKDEAEGRGVYVTIETHLNPVPRVKGSESELREVLTNLIFNAVDAIEQRGSIVIESRQDGDTVVITFTDTGKGMPPEIQKKIFDPFFTTKGKGGTGLGLSVSYGIIQRHHGEITVESEEDKGTKFTLVFPVSKKQVLKEKGTGQRFKIEPARIMIVEDEKNVREALKNILEIDNHHVVSMQDGPTAVERFEQINPDIVFTDLGLPDMNGWEVAEKLHEINPDLPIILCTGWGENVMKEQMEKSGVSLVVGKPFDIEKLRSAIQQVQRSGA